MEKAKLQLMFAAREGCADALVGGLVEHAAQCAKGLASGSSVVVLARLPDDPFGRFQPPMRPFDAVLELVAADGSTPEPSLVAGLAEPLAVAAHLDLSAAFAGRVHSVIPPRATPYRYLYVMRRKAGTNHRQYLDHYTRIHADFGRRTPAITGYEQLHIDEASARAAAQAAGVGVWRADSVSELSIPSLEDFLKALASSPIGKEGPADERNFVDRANSVGQCTEVRMRHSVA